MTLKRLIFVVTVLVLIAFSVYAGQAPEAGDLGVDYQGRFTVIADINNWNPYLEVLGRIDSNATQIDYSHILAGSYFRIHRNIKIGAFYLLQAGVRHDNDWISLNPGWEWEDTADRLENNLILDITPRYFVPLIFNNNAVASFKIRYQYNFFNNHQTLLFKPGVNYFYMIDRKPVWSSSLAYSFYFPLNFSESLLYEHGPYLNFLYHINKLVKLEARANLHFRTWTTGEDSLALGDSYNVVEKGLTFGLGIILTP